ncbi:50S ribosomal protein L25 [candidate division KSB1 bacterium]
MNKISLEVSAREAVGKQAAKHYRDQNFVPGVYYGFGDEAKPLLIDSKNLIDLLSREDAGSLMIDLMIEDGGKEPPTVIIREVQRDPVSGDLLHIDFQHISMDRPVHLEIAIHLSGIAIGVKTKSGILEHILREVEISCLPADIPEHVSLDVSDLDIGDTLHVSDLDIPNTTILTDPDRVLAAVVPPVVIIEPEEEVLEEDEEAVEGEGEEASGTDSETEGGPEEN